MSTLQKISAVDVLIHDLWESVISGEFPNIQKAARSRWDEIEPGIDAGDLSYLAYEGLTYLARKAAAPKKENKSPAIPYGAPHGEAWEEYSTLSFPYLGVEGQKMLLDFTVADWGAFEARMTGAVISAARRVKMAKFVRETLVAKKKATVRDLDKVTRDAIEELAHRTLRVYDPDGEKES